MKRKWLLLPVLLLPAILLILTAFSSREFHFVIPQPSITLTSTFIPTPLPTQTMKPKSGLIYIPSVPFAAQAPFGDWEDPRQQNGCEEAAVIISVYWARNKSLSKQQMLDEIFSVSAFEDQYYGNSVDTSTADTVSRLFQKYYKFQNARVETLTNADQIINWLGEGYLVLTPMDGQAVGNIYFTAPGPERHMIVIRGFDPKTQEFITNDAGTRQGENYRYPKARFFNSIRDYPTGDHNPLPSIVTKSAILVWK